MQGQTTTSRYKRKADRKIFCCFEMFRHTKLRMQGRRTTSRYKCKPGRKTLFSFCWNAPAINIKRAKSTNYISLHMQPIGGHFFVFWHAQAIKTKMQGRTMVFRYKCKPGRKLCLVWNAPAITIKNARSTNYISINMQGRKGYVFDMLQQIELRMRGRTITYRYKCKPDKEKHTPPFWPPPASKTRMHGRTIIYLDTNGRPIGSHLLFEMPR